MPEIWIPKDFRLTGPDPDYTDDYSDAKHERKPHGIIFKDGKEVATTLQCCHCMMHFVSRKGSGTRRGFCLRCMQVTCGAPKCVECRPFMAELEMNQSREL
jgi:hypothetical protein